VAAERRLIDRAETLILLADSSKFRSSSGAIVCELREVDMLITDDGISPAMADIVREAGVELVVVDRADDHEPVPRRSVR
jgi:DeoR family transcriptional regulator, ulaG and ulaABCDEF operon transcriptional repressor